MSETIIRIPGKLVADEYGTKLANFSDLDNNVYGPYVSVAAAHAALSANGLNTVGTTVGISGLYNTVVEYWYQGGTEQANLIKKVLGSNERDAVSFDGFIPLEPVTIIEGSTSEPDAILYSRNANRFVAKKGNNYYDNWEERVLYNNGNEPYTSKLYPYNGKSYTWDGTTFEAEGAESVRYDAQILTAQQKEQVAQNIGLDVVVKGDVQQLLSDAQKVNAQNNMMGKAYAPAQHSGLGKVYLDKNNGVLTQSMMQAANTVYVIQYDYAISANITIPAGCTLEFDGGSISGSYTITLSKTLFTGDVRLKKGLKLAGTLANEEAYSDWYEIVKDGTVSWVDELNCLIDVCNGCLMFGNGTYLITGTYNGSQSAARASRNGLHVKSNMSIIGSDNTIIKQDYSAFFVFTTGFRFIYSTEYLKNNVVSVNNVTFKNIIFQGAYEAFVEYSHILSIESVDGLIIENCKFLNWRGDAICVGWTTAITEEGVNAISKNVTVRDCVFDASSNTSGTRNGISIVGTTSENITIRDNSFSNLGKDDMPGAIDIEQEGMSGSTITLKNVNIQNNTFTNITNGNGVIALQIAIEKFGVRIAENTFNSCNQNVIVYATYCRDIIIMKNTITGTSGNFALGMAIDHFDNCIIDSNILKYNGMTTSPVGWEFDGNNDSILKITGNQLVNVQRTINGFAGFIRITNVGFLTAVNNLLWNCGTRESGSELLNMSVFWFYQSANTCGVISNNLYSNSTGTTTNVNMVINKPDGVTLDANTNIIKSIE